MKHLFQHEFEDDPANGDFEVDLDAPSGARIRFEIGSDGLWVSANKPGWLHLARICAEMGLHSQFEQGYHFHRGMDWADSDGPPEVSFELSGE